MAEDLPPAKRQKLTDEENPSDAASIPHLLEQLPKYVQEANEEELIHLKERHGVAQTQEERPPAPTASSDASANPQPTTTNKPFLKRKMAMVIGYLGYKYQVRDWIGRWSLFAMAHGHDTLFHSRDSNAIQEQLQ